MNRRIKSTKYEKKKLVICICLLLTIGIALGYALLTEQLKLNGSVNYGSMKWDVGFTTAIDGGGTISSSPIVSNDKKSVTVTCNVGTSTASETCIAKTKIKNASSFAVKLEKNPIITFDSTYINSVTAIWTSNNKNVVAADSIESGAEKEIQIIINTKEITKEMLPSNTLTIPVTITMDWVEGNGTEKVTYKLFPELEETYRATTPKTSASYTIAPFYYEDTTLFANKNLTQISMYIKTVSYVNEYAVMTISTIEAPENFVVGATSPTTYLETYTIKLPKTYFNEATNISKWVDIDLTQYAYKSDGTIASNGIEVGPGETIAISRGSDSIVWAVDTGSAQTSPFYYNNSNKLSFSSDNGLYFLFEYQSNSTNSSSDISSSNLSALLNGKTLSVLGDSISTYKNVSNNNTYNSTLSSNAVYYGNISYTSSVSQDETYWQQIIDTFNMKLNVNNSYSGGTVTGIRSTNKATDRASQLHNTKNEKPDIILVYVGINDLRYSQTPELFEEGYTTMLNTIKTNYPNAEVFCIGMPNRNGNDYENGEYTDDEAIAFNTAIQNAISTVNGNFYYIDLFNSEYSDQVYFDNSIDTGTQNQYTNSNLDNLHPNENGMDYITDLIIDKMSNVFVQ